MIIKSFVQSDGDENLALIIRIFSIEWVLLDLLKLKIETKQNAKSISNMIQKRANKKHKLSEKVTCILIRSLDNVIAESTKQP